MKRIVIMALALVIVLTACGGGGNGGGNGSSSGATQDGISETVGLPELPVPVVAAGNVAALAAQQYITAQLYLDALIDFDLEQSTIEEFAALYDGTIEQFELAELYAAQAALATDIMQAYIDSGADATAASYIPPQKNGADATAASYVPPQKSGADTGNKTPANPFVLTAYASGQPNRADELKAWARDVESIYNNLPAQKGIFDNLGQQLGVDARTARDMLQQAKSINEAAAAENDAAYWAWWGDFHDTGMKTAQTTKTTCKVVVLVGGTIATGGATGALAQAALVVNSVDAVVEVGATASLIILGEDHAVTAKLNQIQDYLAPVTAVTGVLTLDFSKITSLANITKGQSGEQLLGAVDYIGNSLVDLIWNDKFMGVDFSKSEGTAGPTTDMTLSAVDISDASIANDPAAVGAKVNEERGGLGLTPLPESALPGAAPPAEKAPLDRAKEAAPKAPPKSVDDYINELLDWLVDVGILTAEEADMFRPGPGGGGDAPTLEELMGHYPDGMATIMDVIVDPAFRAALDEKEEEGDADEDSLGGCDLNMLANIEERIGQTSAAPIVIEITGANTGRIVFGDPEEEDVFDFTYENGVIRADRTATDDGMTSVSVLELKAAYDPEKTSVVLNGSRTVQIKLSDPDFTGLALTIIQSHTGTKSLDSEG